MDDLRINVLLLKELMLINLTNPSYSVSENQILWIRHVILMSMDMIIQFRVLIKDYYNKKIEVFELPELVGIFSKIICDKSNELHMFNLQHIVKMVSYVIEVFIANNIFVVNGDIDVKKLLVNCTALLEINIVEKKHPKTFSEQFANTYMDFIKVLTEPLYI